MIEVTPFVNPFKPQSRIIADGVKVVVKNGKTYKQVVKK